MSFPLPEFLSLYLHHEIIKNIALVRQSTNDVYSDGKITVKF